MTTNTQNNNITEESEAFKKDWFIRISRAIDKLETADDVLAKDINKVREILKEYTDKNIDKLDTTLRKKLEDFLEKIDVVRADSYDEIRQLREDLKEEKTEEKTGRRWFIGIVLVLALSALTAVGGYFISVEVISTKVQNIETSIAGIKSWQNEHHDKIEKSVTTSDRNRTDVDELRKDFRAYGTKKDKEFNKNE